MEHKYIPKFMVAWTFYAWRFVAGAFGKKVERPWRSPICGPFWLSLLGVTAGLPIVLLVYLIRFFIGNEKANKLVKRFTSSKMATAAKWSAILLLFAFTALLIVWAVILFINQPVEMLLVTLTLAGLVAITLGIVKLLTFISRWRDESILEQVRFNDPAAAERKVKAAKVLRTVFLVAVSPFILVWKIVAFIGFMFYAGYKKFCPIVEVK